MVPHPRTHCLAPLTRQLDSRLPEPLIELPLPPPAITAVRSNPPATTFSNALAVRGASNPPGRSR